MKTILCYGDSNTYGYCPEPIGRYEKDERWTGILQQELGTEYDVIEEGLNGRTTVWDDPIEGYKNGKKYLTPCLASHKPVDLVILMLGTNDLKARFSVSAFDIGASIDVLVRLVLQSGCGREGKAPELLLVSPVPIESGRDADFDCMFAGGEEKSEKLAYYYKEVAKTHKVFFLDTSGKVEMSPVDGIHYSKEGQRNMAELMKQKVLEIYQ